MSRRKNEPGLITTLDDEPQPDLFLEGYALSDVGCKRNGNEDAAEVLLSAAGDRGLALVADGMGGHAGGELASGLAAAMFAERFSRYETAEDLADLILEADARIAAEHKGAGTTVVAVLADLETLKVAHLGDSRAYLWRDGTLRQLTSDDSWVQTQVDVGRLTPDQARTHPRRNVLLKAVGTGRQEHATARTFRFFEGDVVLLTSDGLHGVVSEDRIAAAMPGPHLDETARRLVEMALHGGGPDNISVALLRMSASSQDAAERE